MAQPQKQPNILLIMADDLGWFNIGAYHGGVMAGRSCRRDRLEREKERQTLVDVGSL